MRSRPPPNRAGNLEDLNLADDQGLAGLTYFSYHATLQVFLLHRNVQGIRFPAFSQYLKDLTEVAVEFHPVLQPEALRKLQRFRTIRRVRIKLARPNADHYVRQGRSVHGVIGLMRNIEAPVADVTLSMGHSRGSLGVESVVGLLGELYRVAMEMGGEVERIEAFGKEQDEEAPHILDLLQDRMVETFEVPVGNARRPSHAAMWKALDAAYDRRRDDLEEFFAT